MEQHSPRHGPEGWPERAREDARPGDGAARPPGALPAGYGRDEAVTSRDLPVLVNLDHLFPLPDGVGPSTDAGAAADQWRPRVDREPSDVGSGVPHRGRLACTGEVRGVLHRWERRVEGPWIAVVSYIVPLLGDLRPGLHMQRALVPAHAVRPVPEPPQRGRQ